jgi:hypothetical protein
VSEHPVRTSRGPVPWQQHSALRDAVNLTGMGAFGGCHAAARGRPEFCRADYQRRERQRQMKNDEARPSPGAAREEFFPGV